MNRHFFLFTVVCPVTILCVEFLSDGCMKKKDNHRALTPRVCRMTTDRTLPCMCDATDTTLLTRWRMWRSSELRALSRSCLLPRRTCYYSDTALLAVYLLGSDLWWRWFFFCCFSSTSSDCVFHWLQHYCTQMWRAYSRGPMLCTAELLICAIFNFLRRHFTFISGPFCVTFDSAV